jgi:hypothetical protein
MLGGKIAGVPVAASNAFYCHDFSVFEEKFVFGSLFALEC